MRVDHTLIIVIRTGDDKGLISHTKCDVRHSSGAQDRLGLRWYTPLTMSANARARTGLDARRKINRFASHRRLSLCECGVGRRGLGLLVRLLNVLIAHRHKNPL